MHALAFVLQVCGLPFTQAAMAVAFHSTSPKLLCMVFRAPVAVVFLFLFPCCYSHGLAPANPNITVKAGFQGNKLPWATRGESPLLPLLSYHVVLVFSLHEIIQQYVCTTVLHAAYALRVCSNHH